MKLNDFVQAALNNWPVKVISIAAALLLYMLAQTAGLAEREFLRDVRITAPPGLEAVHPLSNEVRVHIRGPKDQIYTILPEQIMLEADFSHVSEPGRHTAFIRIRNTYQLTLIEKMEIHYSPRSLEAEFRRREP